MLFSSHPPSSESPSLERLLSSQFTSQTDTYNWLSCYIAAHTSKTWRNNLIAWMFYSAFWWDISVHINVIWLSFSFNLYQIGILRNLDRHLIPRVCWVSESHTKNHFLFLIQMLQLIKLSKRIELSNNWKNVEHWNHRRKRKLSYSVATDHGAIFWGKCILLAPRYIFTWRLLFGHFNPTKYTINPISQSIKILSLCIAYIQKEPLLHGRLLRCTNMIQSKLRIYGFYHCHFPYFFLV